MRSCKKCIYREEVCADDGLICDAYFEGDPEDLASIETDIYDYTGDEDFDDFCEHEDWE